MNTENTSIWMAVCKVSNEGKLLIRRRLFFMSITVNREISHKIIGFVIFISGVFSKKLGSNKWRPNIIIRSTNERKNEGLEEHTVFIVERV